jgi:hypothetical protein
MSIAISSAWDVPDETMALYEERLAGIEEGTFEVPFVELGE